MNVASSPTPASQQQKPVYWQVSGSLHPGEPAQQIVLKTSRFRIGRRPGLDLSLPSMQISGLHAELVQVGGRVFVRDLNSTNGTYVNGRRINHQDTPLRDGDRIRLGTLEFRLERKWVDQSSSETAVNGLLDTARSFELPTDAPTKDAPQEVPIPKTAEVQLSDLVDRMPTRPAG